MCGAEERTKADGKGQHPGHYGDRGAARAEGVGDRQLQMRQQARLTRGHAADGTRQLPPEVRRQQP